MRRYPQALRFLLAYLIYNDGVQTVVVTAAIFGAEALKISQSTLVLVILMVQLVAFFGALLFGRIAGLVSAKTAVLISLVIWSGTAFYTYGFLSSAFEFWLLGGVIGLVLGGSQALSRSIYAQMIPKDREAEFFSFYELADRGSSLLGPLVFGLTNQWLGSLRYAALSVSFFFVAGLALLTRVNVQKAIQDSRVRQTRDPTVRR
jgi:UMF1 family MFS transporter